MTDTPTTQAAWLLVDGTSYDYQQVAAVFGTRDEAQEIADDWNRNRIREALEVDAETIKPVRVLDAPLAGYLFAPLALHQGDRVRIQYNRGVPDDHGRQYGEMRGIVAKASDDELVVGIHPNDNRDGRMLAQAFAATLSDDLLDGLYAALWQWRYGEGGHERLRVFQAAPELTKRLDVLLDAYSNAVGEVRPDSGDPVARLDDEDDRGLPIGTSYRHDAGDAYVGPPRIVAIARFVVTPNDWARSAPGNLTGDADGFATYLAGVVEAAVTGDLVLGGARVGHAVRIESDR